MPKLIPDDEHVRAFETLTLPLDQWTHRAHVKVAFAYLRRYPFDEAMNRMRAGVQDYNAHYGIPESQTSGYNETTTRAFLRLISATVDAYDSALPTPDAESFCDTHPQLMTRHVLRLFYSPERRRHPLAKTQFVEPDLAPLPIMSRDSCRIKAPKCVFRATSTQIAWTPGNPHNRAQ